MVGPAGVLIAWDEVPLTDLVGDSFGLRGPIGPAGEVYVNVGTEAPGDDEERGDIRIAPTKYGA